MNNYNPELNKIVKMKNAAIESVLVWMLTFIGFGTLFYFVINYAMIIRVQDNMNALCDYGANMIAEEGVGADIVTKLNEISTGNIATIGAGDIVCNSVTESPLTYQVVFTTVTTNQDYKFYTEALQTSRAVFNQVSGDTVTCTLTITLED